MIEIRTKEDFNVIFNSDELSCIKFGAGWCGPCKVLARTLEHVEKDGTDCKIYECDIENEEIADIAAEFGVSNIPFLMFIKNGEILDTAIGVISQLEFNKRVKDLQ